MFMRTILKFTLLSALIIGGKLAKQPAQAVGTQKITTRLAADNSMVMVHQVLTSEPVPRAQESAQRQTTGSGILAELF